MLLIVENSSFFFKCTSPQKKKLIVENSRDFFKKNSHAPQKKKK